MPSIYLLPVFGNVVPLLMTGIKTRVLLDENEGSLDVSVASFHEEAQGIVHVEVDVNFEPKYDVDCIHHVVICQPSPLDYTEHSVVVAVVLDVGLDLNSHKVVLDSVGRQGHASRHRDHYKGRVCLIRLVHEEPAEIGNGEIVTSLTGITILGFIDSVFDMHSVDHIVHRFALRVGIGIPGESSVPDVIAINPEEVVEPSSDAKIIAIIHYLRDGKVAPWYL